MSDVKERNPMCHHLKCWPEYFNVIGILKPFEVRKNDRDFRVGDSLCLQEWRPDEGYSGEERDYVITYILTGEQWGIMDGYCVLGLSTWFDLKLAKITGRVRNDAD